MGESCICLPDPLGFQGEVVGDGGAEVRKVVDGVEFAQSSMVMIGSSSEFYTRTFVFFRLMVSPRSLQAWETRSISDWSSCWVWVATAASSANNMSVMRASRTFVLALRRARLNSLPSGLVRR